MDLFRGDIVYKFDNIEDAIEDIRKGKMVIVVDDPDRENEGDLVMAAEKITGEDINFMAKKGRGLICMPTTSEYLERLNIGEMVNDNTDNYETAFTVTIDHISTTTGISAYERADTIKAFLDEDSKAEDFRRPGHIFPLRAKKNGVLDRIGHTEAAVDLVKYAGFRPVGVICEIMNTDGTMSRVPDLMKFKEEYNLKIITIEDLVEYRKSKEILVSQATVTEMPTKYGKFKAYAYVNNITGEHHLALVKGDIRTSEPVLTRVHSECLTGDALGSMRCDCGEQYKKAMENIAKEGRGVLIYMRQEGRGIGLVNKLKAYSLQDKGYDTVEANIKLGFPADMRDYSTSVHILKDLGVKSVNLMTNNPAKIKGLEKYGIIVNSRVPIEMICNDNNKDYLKTKKEKMNHIMKG